MTYRIDFRKTVKKDLRRLPQSVVDGIQRKIDTLAEEPIPHTAKKLKGYDSYYRIRFDDYRIIYEVRQTEIIILIIRIGHRKNVYRGLT